MLSFNISIDEKQVDELEEMLTDGVESHMDDLATEIETRWRAKASQTLHTSKDKYIEGLHVEADGTTVRATVTGWLPVAVEMGVDRFQMNEGLSKARVVAIVGKDGGETRFRTMKPGAAGWWHPGIIAKKIHEQVFAELEGEILPKVFGEVFSRRTV